MFQISKGKNFEIEVMSQFLKVTLQGVQILPQLNFTHIKSFSSKFKRLFSLHCCCVCVPRRCSSWSVGMGSGIAAFLSWRNATCTTGTIQMTEKQRYERAGLLHRCEIWKFQPIKIKKHIWFKFCHLFSVIFLCLSSFWGWMLFLGFAVEVYDCATAMPACCSVKTFKRTFLFSALAPISSG